MACGNITMLLKEEKCSLKIASCYDAHFVIIAATTGNKYNFLIIFQCGCFGLLS